MEVIFIRFSHLTENISDKLDDKSLAKCRVVSKKWQDHIDNQKNIHVRKIKTTIKEFHEVGDSWKRLFNKSTTQAIMDLSDSVEKFYVKGSNLEYHKGLTPLHVEPQNGHLEACKLTTYSKC